MITLRWKRDNIDSNNITEYYMNQIQDLAERNDKFYIIVPECIKDYLLAEKINANIKVLDSQTVHMLGLVRHEKYNPAEAFWLEISKKKGKHMKITEIIKTILPDGLVWKL